MGSGTDSYLKGYSTTYGYAPTGEILAKDAALDVEREKEVFAKTAKIIVTLQPNIDSKTWWKVRDQLRGTNVYSMRQTMLALNNVLPTEKKEKAVKTYKKFWSEVEALDLACVKKEQALATKKNADMITALGAYQAAI